MIKVDCKSYAQAIKDAVKKIPDKGKLCIYTMGDDPASAAYVRGKIRDCEECGIPYDYKVWGTQTELSKAIRAANADTDVAGIIVQLPLPDGIDERTFIEMVDPVLDVDGFLDDSAFLPCTPEGIMRILHGELGNLSGKDALVIGRGNLVGRPIAEMLLAADCTVTIAHSRTKCLASFLKRYDIIICAAGTPRLIDLKECDAEIVVDVSTNYDEEGRLCGDCYNFDPDDDSEMLVTTVPGGIGLMTRAVLMNHVASN